MSVAPLVDSLDLTLIVAKPALPSVTFLFEPDEVTIVNQSTETAVYFAIEADQGATAIIHGVCRPAVSPIISFRHRCTKLWLWRANDAKPGSVFVDVMANNERGM